MSPARTHTYELMKFTENWDFTHAYENILAHILTNKYTHTNGIRQHVCFGGLLSLLSFGSSTSVWLPPALFSDPALQLQQRIFSFHFYSTGFLFKNIICWLLAPVRRQHSPENTVSIEPTIFLPHFPSHVHMHTQKRVCVCVCALVRK